MAFNQQQQYPNQQQGGFQQQQQPQQMQGHIAPSQAPSNDPWSPSVGGGGLSEFIGTVKNCKPDSNKQQPDKQNLTWEMHTHEGKPQNKSWGIGKDWQFNWAGQPPAYVDPKNPSRTVNENATLGVLLRCIRDGAPFDLREAGPILRSRPGGPLSPVAWVGTRWHFCKVVLDFGQGPREVLFPIAFLGIDGTPLPNVQWRTQDHSSPGMQQGGMQAPMGQIQGQPQQQVQQGQANFQQGPANYVNGQNQNFQAQAPQQQPNQQFQQPMQGQNFQQSPQQQQQQYPPQQQQQQFQQPNQPYAAMPPGGYGQGAFPGHGGGPAAGMGFPGQQ